MNASRYFTGFSMRESGPILAYPLEIKANAKYQFFTVLIGFILYF